MEPPKKKRMDRRRRCDTPQEDIMRDTVEVPRQRLQELVDLYRNDSYIRAASQKRQIVTLNGGICARIGGLIDLPYFNDQIGNRIDELLERVVEWHDVAGFIPFSVTPTPKCDETSGTSIGFGSDEARELLGNVGGANADAGTNIDYIENTTLSDETESEVKLRPPLSSIETSDFEFMVPSLGIGRYKVYRDSRDNIRRVIYIDPDEKNEDDEDDTAATPPPIWYVYVIEEPHADGSPNSPCARLQAHAQYLNELENLEKSGAALGYHPVVVTQATPPGKGLHSLDHHMGYTTDLDVIQIPAKDTQGMPVGFRDHIRKIEERSFEMLRSAGINPNTGDLEHFGAVSDLPRINIEPSRQFAQIVRPTKLFDIEEKRREYVNRVAIEFGVPVSDLYDIGGRYKPERLQQSSSLIEKSRRLRRVLINLLYYVFELRNNGRMYKKFIAAIDETGAYMRDMQAVISETKALIERARKDAVKPQPLPTEENEEKQTQSPADPAHQQSPETQTDEANVASSSDVSLPSTVDELVAWVKQVEISFTRIGNVNAALERMTNSDKPLVLAFKQPIVVDATQLANIASELGLDEAQRASLSRYHFGMGT